MIIHDIYLIKVDAEWGEACGLNWIQKIKLLDV